MAATAAAIGVAVAVAAGGWVWLRSDDTSHVAVNDRPQQLGVWRPVCDDMAADAGRLYRNLALQEIFANEVLELWQFPEWQPSARQAVVPLATCDDAYLHRLADHLPGNWGDATAASIVAEEIRVLTSFSALPDAGGLKAMGVCRSACTVSGRAFFDHPAWGPSVLLTTVSAERRAGSTNIAALDAGGELRWHYQAGTWFELGPAQPARDTTGHLFLNYNPGRYNGVIILRPSPAGFDDFESLPPPGDHRSRFYSASVTDADGDGQYEIDSAINDCNPSCAQGTTQHTIYRWDGTGYTAG